MATKKEENKFLQYRGKPLVRCGNTIYYGNMNDPFVIMLQITGTKKAQDIDVPDRVLIQLLNTDPDCRPRDRIVKKSEKKGLYNAMDISTVWLERALEKKSS
jgi:hypothetical protein